MPLHVPTPFPTSVDIAEAVWLHTPNRRLTNIDDVRAARIDNLDDLISSRSSHSAADVWTNPTRELTQTQFPFWSAIITPTGDSITIPATSDIEFTIQPPANETWNILLSFCHSSRIDGSTISIADIDGAMIWYTMRSIYTGGTFGKTSPEGSMSCIMTNSRYLNIYAFNASGVNKFFEYSYSGFKLSKQKWSPEKVQKPEFKIQRKETTLRLPAPIALLQKYAREISGLNREKPEEHTLAVILEENTPLSIDPKTGFPVERLTVFVKADILADLLTKFKSGEASPDTTGYRKYLRKWKDEGIDL